MEELLTHTKKEARSIIGRKRAKTLKPDNQLTFECSLCTKVFTGVSSAVDRQLHLHNKLVHKIVKRGEASVGCFMLNRVRGGSSITHSTPLYELEKVFFDDDLKTSTSK